ncbi:hypothetical protein HID58_096386, partial [Brassica napus]
ATEPPLDSNGNNGEQGLDVGERGLGSDSGKSVGGGIKVTEVLVERSGIEIEETHAVVDGESSGLVNGVDLPVTLSQYRIVEGKKEMVTREGVTDKGNAKSPVREKSSYAEAVNVGTGTTAGPDFEIVDGVADIEIPTEIFEDVEPLWKRSDKEVVLKLLSDLEQIDAIVVDVNNTVERIEEGPMNGAGEVLQTRKDGEWTQNGKPSSPRENLQSQGECRVVSPNGFQVLSGIREEGEIDEEEEENGTMRNDGFHLQEVGGNKEERGDASESQERELQTSHVSNQKGRGKGSRMQLPSSLPIIRKVPLRGNNVVDFRLEHAWVQQATQTKSSTVLVTRCTVIFLLLIGNSGTNGEFSEVVDNVWNSQAPLYHSRSALKLFHSKLKSLKGDLRGLNKDLFGDLPSRVKLAYEDLCLKQAVATDLPTTAAFEDVSAAWEHWHHISGIEEQFYFQKSKVKWLGLGDRNNCFYHNVCKARNSKNAIRHQLWFVKYEQRQDGLFVELATDNSERLSTRLKLFS